MDNFARTCAEVETRISRTLHEWKRANKVEFSIAELNFEISPVKDEHVQKIALSRFIRRGTIIQVSSRTFRLTIGRTGSITTPPPMEA